MTANRVYAQPVHAPVAEGSDDELMRELAHGQQEALGPLYSRYAALVFHMAHQSLDRPAAEEIVQEVFLTIWRGAASAEWTIWPCSFCQACSSGPGSRSAN